MSLMRYFFDQDDSSHWYLIPENLREEWYRLSEIEDSWELDEWQQFENCRIDGISSWTFTDPKE